MKNFYNILILLAIFWVAIFILPSKVNAATQEEYDDLIAKGYTPTGQCSTCTTGTPMTDPNPDDSTYFLNPPGANCNNEMITVVVQKPVENQGTGEVSTGDYCSMCGCTSCVWGGAGSNSYKCNGDACDVTPTVVTTNSSPSPTPTKTPRSSSTPSPRASNTPSPKLSNSPTPGLSNSPTPKPSNTPTATRTPSPTRPPTPTPTPRPTNTPTPTFTPTPTPFNPAACTCDGITYTTISSGKPLTVTSFGKVTGPDTSKAQIVDQKFFLAEGAETLATIIARSDSIPATVISNSSSLVRYQSVWNLTLPQLKSGATYRIWSQINCQPKLAAVNTASSNKKVVLAAETKKSFLDIILAPFTWLFGGSSRNFVNSQPSVTPVSVGGTSVGSTADQPTSRESLQLQTIQPVEVYQKTCSFIKFRYNFSAN